MKKTYKLNNEVEIPSVGFGTWKIEDSPLAKEVVVTAIQNGYTHIDTAQIYKNEKSVGEGIKSSGKNREDLFITTKLWNDVTTYDEAIASFNGSMERLDLEYLDLLLIHWPNPLKLRDNKWQERNKEVYRAMEDLYEAGKIKSIGISNFKIHHIEELLKTARIVPQVNQIKICPGVEDTKLIEYCQEKKIILEAYSPLGRGDMLTNEVIVKIAEKYGKTPAQVTIRWSLDKGYLPLPKSQTKERIISNYMVYDFALTKEEVEEISSIQYDKVMDSDTVEF